MLLAVSLWLMPWRSYATESILFLAATCTLFGTVLQRTGILRHSGYLREISLTCLRTSASSGRARDLVLAGSEVKFSSGTTSEKE
jgi:hypothetical protein